MTAPITSARRRTIAARSAAGLAVAVLAAATVATAGLAPAAAEEPVNQPPVLHDIVQPVVGGTVNLGDWSYDLGTFSDPEGDPLSLVGVSPVSAPLPGESFAELSGNWVYTAPTGFTGQRAWTFTVTDGVNQVSATCMFNISAPPPPAAEEPPAPEPVAPPVAVDDTVTVAKGAQIVFDPAANDTGLQAYTVLGGFTSPGEGLLSAVDTHAFTYNAPNVDTTTTMTYRLKHNDAIVVLSNWATVTIVVGSGVNSPPVAVDDSYLKPMGVWQTGNVLDNDTDPNGDTLSVTWGAAPVGTLQGNATGDFAWTPPASTWSGTVQVPYTVDDSRGGTDTGLLTITTPADEETPVAVADFYTAWEGQTLSVDAPGGLLANDSDADTAAGKLAIMALTAGLQGTLDVEPMTGAFDYTPPAGFTGTTSFVYRINDPAGHWSQIVPVTIQVLPNDGQTPFAADDHVAAQAYTDLVVGTANGVLANDLDPNGDPLHVLVSGAAGHGDVTVLPDGGLVYSPDAGFVGTDTVEYRASDGAHTSNWATVTIEVTAVPGKWQNMPPTSINHQYQAVPDEALVVDAAHGLFVGASDADSFKILVADVSQPAKGQVAVDTTTGAFTFTPQPGFQGPTSFQFRLADNQGHLGEWRTVSIQVGAVVLPPEPGQPGQLGQPGQPGQPVEPGQPDQPVQPSQPSQPADSAPQGLHLQSRAVGAPASDDEAVDRPAVEPATDEKETLAPAAIPFVATTDHVALADSEGAQTQRSSNGLWIALAALLGLGAASATAGVAGTRRARSRARRG